MRPSPDTVPTVQIPRESLAACAAAWREQLKAQGLVKNKEKR